MRSYNTINKSTLNYSKKLIKVKLSSGFSSTSPCARNQGGLRELIEKYGININSSANGAILPQKAMSDWPGQVTHFPFNNIDKKGNPMFRHGQEYIEYIGENFKKIDKLPLSSQVKKERILSFLEETREGLLTGKLEILYQD